MGNKRVRRIGSCLILLGLFVNAPTSAQVWQGITTPYDYDHIAGKKSLLIPTGCGIPVGMGQLLNNKLRRASLYWDTCAKKLYTFSPNDSTWVESGGADLSTKLNIVDTSGMLFPYFRRNGNMFGATAVLGTNDNFPLIFRTNGSDYLALTTTGRFGIRTTAPLSRLDVRSNPLGTTQDNTAGIYLSNTTAAAAGAQQISPPLIFRGSGWKTNAPAASQTVDYRMYAVPVQGASAPTSYLNVEQSVDGGAWASILEIHNTGIRMGSGGGGGINWSGTPGSAPTPRQFLSVNGIFFGTSGTPAASTYDFSTSTGYAQTSGLTTTMRISNGVGFNPTSGNAQHFSLHVTPVVNQTGGASGMSGGLRVSPTLTSAADFRSLMLDDGKIALGPAVLPTITSTGSNDYVWIYNNVDSFGKKISVSNLIGGGIGNLGLSKSMYDAPVVMNPVTKVASYRRQEVDSFTAKEYLKEWFPQKTPLNAIWTGITYSPELRLYVATSHTGSSTGIMTSPDAQTWTLRSTPSLQWRGVAWSPELHLFAAVASTGTGNRVMTSPDGITWTAGVSPADNVWRHIIWVKELGMFVACATGSGLTDRVMTSPDGINWTVRSTPAIGGNQVVWSPELHLLVVVGSVSNPNKVITSPDGINWTARSTAALPGANLEGACWSAELGLFVAIDYRNSPFTTDGQQILTSPDGINWTVRSTPLPGRTWLSVAWSPELGQFAAVADNGNGSSIMTSTDAINWTVQAATNRDWRRIIWVKELGSFVSVAFYDGSALGDSLIMLSKPIDVRQQYVLRQGPKGGQIINNPLILADTLKTPNIISQIDTADFKPKVVDANGNEFKLSHWPSSRLVDSLANVRAPGVISSAFAQIGDSSINLPVKRTSIFFGNSLFAGTTINPAYMRASTQIANLTNVAELNRAIGGTRMVSTVANDSSMQNRTYLIPTKTSSYDKLYFEYGTNDIRTVSIDTATYRSVYNGVIDNAIGKGWLVSDIVVVGPGILVDANPTIQSRVSQFAKITKDLAEKKRVIYADTYKAMSARGGTELLKSDNLHHTERGIEVWVNEIARAIGSTGGTLRVNGYASAGTLTLYQMKNPDNASVLTAYDTTNLSPFFELRDKYNGTNLESFGMGVDALSSITTGSNNVAIGGKSMQSTTNGSGNIAIGYNTLNAAQSAASNVAVGMNVLRIATANENVGVGRDVHYSLTTGSGNTGLGHYALRSNVSSSFNSAFGYYSFNNAISSHNAGLGANAGRNTTSGVSNTAVGSTSLFSNSTGSANTGIGYRALRGAGGDNNTGVGAYAGDSLEATATVNTFIGYRSGYRNKAVTSNTFIGAFAGQNNFNGSNNTGIGGYWGKDTSLNKQIWLSTGDQVVSYYADVPNSFSGAFTTTPQYAWDVNGKLGIRTVSNGSPTDSQLVIKNNEVLKRATLTLDEAGYVPTVSMVSNVDGATVSYAQYSRVGNMVTVSGAISIDATAINNQTVVDISLPIATLNGNLSGTIAGDATGAYGSIRNASNKARFSIPNIDVNTNIGYTFIFQYKIQ